MAALSVPIPMTPRTFYPNTALSQNKSKLERIGRTWYREIKQAETLTKVPGALILSVIFTESGGNPEARSSAGACGLMQLKPQTANDVIHLEHKTGRLTTPEKNLLLKHLGARLQGPLRQKYLSHKIPENNFSGNVITPQDLFIPELNVLLGSIYLASSSTSTTKDATCDWTWCCCDTERVTSSNRLTELLNRSWTISKPKARKATPISSRYWERMVCSKRKAP
jgi:hypothetical protein